MKQMDIVYHLEYGKGIVINKTLKGKDYLVMCRFGDTVDWSLESNIIQGIGNVTLKQGGEKQKLSEHSIDDLIKTLISGG